MRKMEVTGNARPARRPAGFASGGFTIVELLTVMVIVGVLVAMVAAAAHFARIAAMQADINSEIGQLSSDLKAYKAQLGEYPPDYCDPDNPEDFALIKRHLLKVFRYVPEDEEELKTLLRNNKLEPGTALVFWLGGVMKEVGTGDDKYYVPIGFSANPKNPFDPEDKNRIGPFFDFDPQRLTVDFDPQRLTVGGQYCPKGFNISDKADVYNYFRAERRSYEGKMGGSNTAPYWTTELNEWVNRDTFQILSPGLDGIYGSSSDYPPNGDDEQGLDDQTNFSGGPLKDKMP